MVVLRWLVVVAMVGVLAHGGTAAAASDKREVQARTDFAAGRYQQAIEGFAQLYGETLDPIYLRNIARCHQKLRRPNEAIDAFRDYLRKGKNLSAGERAEVEGYIKEMEALRAAPAPAATPAEPARPAAAATPAEEPAAAVTPIPGPASTTAGTGPAVTAAEPNLRTSSIAMLPPGSDGGGWRALGVVTTLVGVALVGTGVALGISAHNAASAVSSQYDPDRASAGERNEKLSFVGYGLGAAAIVTGILVYAHGMNQPPTMATLGMRARPSLGGGWTGLTLGGEF